MIFCNCGSKMCVVEPKYPILQVVNNLPKSAYNGELYGCPGCGNEVVANVSKQPFTQWNDTNWSVALEHILNKEHTKSTF